jgi:hypothetical protein
VRLLLDENLDWRLSRDLIGHETDSVPLLGWGGTKNGALLKRAAESGYEVRSMELGAWSMQQNIKSLPLAVIALRARTNRLADTRPLIPEVLRMLGSVQPGTLVFVG